MGISWRFSKSFGGLRIGFGGSSRSRAARGPSQKELQQQDNQRFLTTVEERFNDAVTQWFVKQGHLVLPEDAISAQSDTANVIRSEVTRFIKAKNMSKDSGKLSIKHKEQMLEAIYQIEERVERLAGSVHPLADVYERHMGLTSTTSGCICLSAICLLLAIAWPNLLWASGGLFAAWIGLWIAAAKHRHVVMRTAVVVVSKF